MPLFLLMHQIKERVNIMVGPTVTLPITKAVLPHASSFHIRAVRRCWLVKNDLCLKKGVTGNPIKRKCHAGNCVPRCDSSVSALNFLRDEVTRGCKVSEPPVSSAAHLCAICFPLQRLCFFDFEKIVKNFDPSIHPCIYLSIPHMQSINICIHPPLIKGS